DAVVVDVDLSVVVEVAVDPTRQADGDAGINVAVVVDVDLTVEIRVSAVGVHDQRVASGDGLSVPDGGRARGDALDLRAGGHADAGEVARGRAGLRRDD